MQKGARGSTQGVRIQNVHDIDSGGAAVTADSWDEAHLCKGLYVYVWVCIHVHVEARS